MTEKYRVHELGKFRYSDIGEYVDEYHTDRPLRNDELVDLLNNKEHTINEMAKTIRIYDDGYIDLNKKYKKVVDENEQLKKEIDKLKHRHSLLHDVCIEAECDRDRYHKDVVSLEKENEQLKSTNMEMEDYLGRLEETNINLQIKLQKIRDYAKEDGEVKQGIIEKVILND